MDIWAVARRSTITRLARRLRRRRFFMLMVDPARPSTRSATLPRPNAVLSVNNNLVQPTDARVARISRRTIRASAARPRWRDGLWKPTTVFQFSRCSARDSMPGPRRFSKATWTSRFLTLNSDSAEPVQYACNSQRCVGHGKQCAWSLQKHNIQPGQPIMITCWVHFSARGWRAFQIVSETTCARLRAAA